MSLIIFSIIIPHKNIPDLLQRCLDSIPIREDIQVIVVDDNSSPDIVDFEHFPMWKGAHYEYYLTKEGKGAGYARNVGLSHVEGKWVTFVDSDDFLASDAERYFDCVRGKETDIVFCKARAVMCDEISKPSNRYFYGWYFDDYFVTNDESLLRYRFHSLHGKFVRMGMIRDHNIRFHETRYSNDVYFSACIGCYASGIHVINDVFYILTERSNSLASSQFGGTIISVKECVDRLNESINVRILYTKLRVPVRDNQLYEYSKKLRKYHTEEYILYLLKLLFTHPCYFALLIKKDFSLVCKKLCG